MVFHKFDPLTKLFIESIEAATQPENAIAGRLPEMTTEYTCALIDGEIVSVLRPKVSPSEMSEQEKAAEASRAAKEEKLKTFSFKGTTSAALRAELNEYLELKK